MLDLMLMDRWTCSGHFCMHIKTVLTVATCCSGAGGVLHFTVSQMRTDILLGNYSLCVPVSVVGWLSCSTSTHLLLNMAPDCCRP